MTTTTGITTRDDIEAALWRWSGWRAEQPAVDDLLRLIDQYARRADTGAQRAADDVLARARIEAAQIVQSARDEAAAIQSAARKSPERPSLTLTEMDPAGVSTDVWRDARGAVWVRIVSTPAITGERTKRCTACKVVKGELLFRPDARAGGGRRAQCRDCENDRIKKRRTKKNK